MKKHSRISKFLHKIYLKNYFISKATLAYELDKFNDALKNTNLEKIVFISGLARSGTTSLLRVLHDTNCFASLQYKNMPFLFLPNTSIFKSEEELFERSHKDGIKVNGESPEAFDEYFWKAFLNDAYITPKSMLLNKIEDELLVKYTDYIKLISISKKRNNYLSKNNNAILRIASLVKIPNAVFFFLVRRPYDHASSLLKLHLKFSEDHKQDSFSLAYFDFLGHHEFGLNHKAFRLKEDIFKEIELADKTTLTYWLLIWKQYYSYLLEIYDEKFNLVLFEDLAKDKNNVCNYINQLLELAIPLTFEAYIPPIYEKFDVNLLDECMLIYNELSKNVKY